MFNNAALDVFIGLVFVFLLYSLLATILQEIVARMLNLRSKLLLNAIRVMLQDRDEEADEPDNPLWKTITRFFDSFRSSLSRYFNPLPSNKFVKVFYKHPAVKYLGESSWQSKPSYLEPSNFSSTMVKLLRGKAYDGSEPQMDAIYRTLFEPNQNNVMVETGKKTIVASIEPETLRHIQQLYTDAHKDADRFKTLLEGWFNETMDRATGWYKRQTQWILFFIGFSIAITFNVDTIAIYKLLAKDKTARENLVQLAITSKPKYDTLVKATESKQKSIITIDTLKNKEGKDSVVRRTRDTIYVALSDGQLNNAYKTVQSDIDKANSIAALGWPDADSCKLCKALQEQLKKSSTDSSSQALIKDSIRYYNSRFQCNGNPYQNGIWLRLLGWILTALAVSLGAPFWFDMLNKIMQLRSAGAKPKKDGDNSDGNTKNSSAPGSSPTQRAG